MRKFSLVGLVMALCILFSCSLVQAQDLRTISVDGSSTIKVAPDKVTISISIEKILQKMQNWLQHKMLKSCKIFKVLYWGLI